MRWALRDTLVAGFMAQMEGKVEGAQGKQYEEGKESTRLLIGKAFDDLIALALCVTAHRVV